MQLFAIANVCPRFKRIAQDVFASKHNGKLTLGVEGSTKIPLWLADEYLRMFGPLVSIIDSRISSTNQNIIFALVSKYCENVVRINGTHWDNILPAFNHYPKLVDLCIEDSLFGVIQSDKACSAMNSQLKTLTMHNVKLLYDFGAVLSHLPNLQSLSMDGGLYQWNDVTCFRQMQQLKSLRLKDIPMSEVLPVLNAISNENIQLETLELYGARYRGTDFTCFRRFSSLKSLVLSFYHDEPKQHIFDALLSSGNVQLESLKLVDVCQKSGSLTESICQMRSIKCLQINNITDASLLRIVQEIEPLSEIESISYGMTIRGIREALEQSRNLTKVRIHKLSAAEPIDSNLDAINELRKTRHIDLMIDLMWFSYTLEV